MLDAGVRNDLFNRPAMPPPPAPPPVAPTAPPAGTHLTDSQVQSEAKHILDVGDRSFRSDDYDGRLQAFAETVKGLDADSASRLTAEFFNHNGVGDDGGAFSSWLQGDRLQDLQSNGRISHDEASAVVDAFAGAYTKGAIGGPYQAMSFFDQRGSGATQMAPGIAPQYAQGARDVLALGSSAAMNPFREKFATDLLATAVAPENARGMGLDAGYAMQIVADSHDPNMAARIYGDFNPDERGRVFDALAHDSIGYRNSHSAFPGGADPLNTLVNSVAGQTGWARTGDGDTWGDVAVDLVRRGDTDLGMGESVLAVGRNGADQTPPGRAEAYTRLFEAHGQHIFDVMTDGRNSTVTGDEGASSASGTVAGRDGLVLSKVLGATVLNDNNTREAQGRGVLMDYVTGLQAQAAKGDSAAISHLGHLGAAISASVDNLQLDLKGDAEAREQMVSFVADLALAAAPGGGMVSKALDGAFGESVMGKVASKGIDHIYNEATGKLTDEGKKAISDALGEDSAALADAAGGVNWALGAISAGADPAAGNYVDRLESSISSAKTEIDRAR